MGGEAAKTFQYFDQFIAKGHSVWIICHRRVAKELKIELTPNEFKCIRFINDSSLQILLWKVSQLFPERIRELFFGMINNLIFQKSARKVAETLIDTENIQIVFQPTPNTPFLPSMLYDLGVPVVMGPLSGGMTFPPGLNLEKSIVRNFIKTAQTISKTSHYWIPGKLKADALLVANPKTYELLPKNCQGKIYEGIIESGVNLDQYTSNKSNFSECRQKTKPQFIFTGRLVEWKGVDYLLKAFELALHKMDADLLIIGSGSEQKNLETQAYNLNIADNVHFCGWLSHQQIAEHLAASDVFIMPSLRESGGNSVLEAMAMGLPVIVADWGGPSILVDETCGIKVSPTSPKDFINGLSEAIQTLAHSQELRNRLGRNGLHRVKTNYFDWNSKVNYILRIFEELVQKYNL